jgi:hypothetical protein
VTVARRRTCAPNWLRCQGVSSGWATLLCLRCGSARGHRVAPPRPGWIGLWVVESSRGAGPTMRGCRYPGAAGPLSGCRSPIGTRERDVDRSRWPSRAVAARLILVDARCRRPLLGAMTQTGATRRDELAALLPRHRDRQPAHCVGMRVGACCVTAVWGTGLLSWPDRRGGTLSCPAKGEQAVCRLPLPSSLALRRREAGVAPDDVVCE